MSRVAGTIYLVHLDRPYKHAKHYLGWTTDLASRLAQHADGTGARLLQVARDAGIGWQLARTWPGARHRERQLKRQGGRSRMCPLCKQPRPQAKEAAIDNATPPAGHPDADGPIRAMLPAEPASARRARSAVRTALAGWGIDDPHRDAELLVSEVVANAAEHGGGQRIGLALSRHREPGGQPGITCEVTDASPRVPEPRQAGPGAERGRGMAIVAALATTSGVRAGPAGKTTWFTLALHHQIERAARQGEPEFEAGT